MERILRVIIMFVLAPVLVIALMAGGLIALGGGAMFITGGVAGVPIILYVTAQVLTRHRRQCDLAALAHLEHAVRLNLPLSDMLAAAGRSETGSLAARLTAMSDDLAHGAPVAEAVGRSLRSLPPRTISLIEAAEQSGSLAPQLLRILEEERRAFHREASREPLSVIYPLVVLGGLTGLLGLAGWFIAPKYAKIYEDFEIELPAVSQQVLSLAPVLGGPVMLVGVLIIVFLCAVSLWQIANPSMAMLHRRVIDAAQRVAWRLPILHGIERNRGLADVFDALGDALEAGHPLPKALERVETLAINPVLRGRVTHWRKQVVSGAEIGDAARQAGLPALAAGMLRSGAAAGNLPAVCRFLARYFTGRFSRVAVFIRGAIIPFVIIVLASLVGLVVFSLFLPMVRLTEHAAASAL